MFASSSCLDYSPAMTAIEPADDGASLVLQMIGIFRHVQPERLALQGTQLNLSYEQLWDAVHAFSQILLEGNSAVIGIAIDNHPAWAVADIAIMHTHTINKVVAVPLPLFFSQEQMGHAVMDAGIQSILCDQPELIEGMLALHRIPVRARAEHVVAGLSLTRFDVSVPIKALPSGTAKITYTSGTTGQPKGVCLSQSAMEQVAISLRKASLAHGLDRHLSVLPLSTLLENIAGLYVPLISGACAILTSASDVGLSGSSGLDIMTLRNALTRHEATTTVFTPELLHALLLIIEAGYQKPQCLRFIAVGGASVSPQLLARAAVLRLPVYEGYGLSECASVVSLNTPQWHMAGTAGKPLSHVGVSIAEDGEILVKGANFLGYVGHEPLSADAVCATGDIGYLDEAGYLHITGRKKSMFITSYGRNVAPEWIERELCLIPHILQAALFGEARPWNVALIVARPQSSTEQIQSSIDSLNLTLPDYARVTRWIYADAPFTPANQQRTPNGRLRRVAILQHYAESIAALY